MTDGITIRTETAVTKLQLILYSILVPSILLGFSTVVIPLVMPTKEFGDWRYLSTIIGFSGISQLGALDGLYFRWLTKNKDQKINAKSLSLILIVSIFVGFLITSIYLIFNKEASRLIIGLVFLLCLITPFYGFSVTFIQIFYSSTFVRNFIPIQGSIFVILIGIFASLGKISATLMVTCYIVSLCPSVLILFMQSGKWIKFSGLSVKTLIMGGGFSILIGNLGIILLSNIDKIFVGRVIGSGQQFAAYALAGSLSVAAVNIGTAIGNLVLSRNLLTPKIISKLMYLYLAFIFISTLLVYPSDLILLRIFKKYDTNYIFFLEMAFLIFFYSAFIFPPFKLLAIKTSSLINFILCILYLFIYGVIYNSSHNIWLSPIIMCFLIFSASIFCIIYLLRQQRATNGNISSNL